MKPIRNRLRFISFYTKNTVYEKTVKDCLVPGLEHWGLPYHIFAVDDLGEWKINSRQRPLYIKKAMELFPTENILWIDADAKILKFPDLLYHIPDACDVGVNYLHWQDHYSHYKDSDRMEILDGTSYYKNSPFMLTFMDEWIDKAVIQGNNHRLTLDVMIKERIHVDLNLFLIPREYCYIMTQPDGTAPAKPLENPTIAHFQASRLARTDLYGKHSNETGF